ncbi:f-box domain-containing protein [Fusarium pseudoanthophilum]|uniref:F-box domain-containing protein n=1 Tax=Fusarium pseudoanthophilum TaxID=48495 RepID=A0A8H5PNC6_9HYPO|nr:f-box domain-containing protein [Fusarium pseudoanthophilum]
MACWNSLPQEIRSAILGCVLVHDHIAPYAPVSIEWRDAIEEKIFRRLCIQAPSSDALGSTPMVFHRLSRLCDRRRRLVKHIYVELITRNGSESLEHGVYMSVAITWLFHSLQSWPAQDDLTLEINMLETMNFSAEWLKRHHVGGPREQDADLSRLSNSQLESFVMGFSNSARSSFASFAFKLQVCPSVQAVTRFLLPRQCRRRVEAVTISCILERLPRLEEISLETWDVSEIYVDDHINRFAPHLFSHPEHFKNVKSMTVFQDRNEPLNAAIHRQRDEYRRRFPRPILSREVSCHRPVLAREIAVASLSLENLSLSFFVDALDFFGQCREDCLWADLRSLTLTSRLLTCNGDSVKIHGLLQTAARMAKRMPKLERLIIWNGGANEACAFTYRKQQHIASVTWQAKGGTKLNPQVYSTWENLHSGCLFKVEEKDTWHSITSQVAAIMCLGLEHVVDHVSLRQMQLEDSTP